MKESDSPKPAVFAMSNPTTNGLPNWYIVISKKKISNF